MPLGTGQCYGSFDENAVFEEDELAVRPDVLSSERAATMPFAFLTVMQVMDCFTSTDPRRPLRRALIHGGSGGVGSAAVFLVKHNSGAERVYATYSARNMEYVRSIWVDRVIDYGYYHHRLRYRYKRTRYWTIFLCPKECRRVMVNHHDHHHNSSSSSSI